jgi:hypothetical protein
MLYKSLLVAALLTVALTACSKKEESAVALPPAVAAPTLPPPATPPVLPNAASAEMPAKPADQAGIVAPSAPAGENTSSR